MEAFDPIQMDTHLFSTADIAELLNMSPQAVNKKAKTRGWKPSPTRKQGGGFMWRWRDLDPETREKVSIACIELYRAANPPDPKEEEERQERMSARWQEFNKKPSGSKERAFRRNEILQDVLRLKEQGASMKQAFEAAAQEHGVRVGTLRNWYYGANGRQGVHNIAPQDWIPFLADNYKGRIARAHCDETAWEFIKKDYLRKEQPAFTACFRRLEEAAILHAWVIPCARTLSRRLVWELGWAVIEFRRSGRMFNTFPFQERRRDTFRAGQAVSGDALCFDRVYVYDELTGEVFNPYVWFFEDVHSGKILAWESDTTENSDMFRMAVYNLTAEVLPEVMFIDNTRAAANKCLTGQVAGRHRFTDRATDPVGILKHMKIDVHFTNPDHEIASPGSKPIERAFGIGNLHDSMRQWPSLMGRGAKAKPIPYSEFLALLPEVVAEHNARTGRTGGICNGRSFDEVYGEGLRNGAVRKASPELRRLLLHSQEVCMVSKHCTVSLKAGRGHGRHRYYGEGLSRHIGEKVAVLFNPRAMSEQVTIYDLQGREICAADWIPTTAFNDTQAAREHAKHRSRQSKFIKKAAEEAVKMSDLEFQQLNAPAAAVALPDPARIVTVLSEPEIRAKLKHTVSPERQKQLRENLQKNIAEGRYPFLAEV